MSQATGRHGTPSTGAAPVAGGPPRVRAELNRYGATIRRIRASLASSGTRPTAMADVYAAREDALLAIHVANRFLCAYPWDSSVRVAGQDAFDAVLLDVHLAKWHLGRLDGSYADFAPAVALSNEASDRATALEGVRDSFLILAAEALDLAEAWCAGAAPERAPRVELAAKGTEIDFAGDVPLLPTICPVVVLAGSNRDMGRQYAQQVIEIYGEWIFAQLAHRQIDDQTRQVLARWTAELSERAPEVLEFALGWAAGARTRGVPLTDEQAVAVWTGYRPPSSEHVLIGAELTSDSELGALAYSGAERLATVGEPTDLCSGVCAWDAATADGALAAASTTDHDCTFQATIVAFPDEGNRFIYTPFSANGSIPVLGRFYMAGHPGFNDKGVAYVHHGGQGLDGASCGGGPRTEWGYGLRRGAATFHLLQFADTAAQARNMLLDMPVGDPGPVLGTVGGMVADSSYGFVVEERAGSPHAPAPILRDATYDAAGHAHAFLYANNNPVSPDHGAWIAPTEGRYRYDREAGWYITRPEDAGTGDPGLVTARMTTKNSAARNRYLYRQMMSRYGSIDADHLFATYRRSSALPEGSYEAAAARWRDGEEWDASTGHRGNAFTAVIRPSPTVPGEYYGCIGPAARDVEVREPGHGNYYFDETNSFWRLRLMATPQQMLRDAETEAQRRVQRAETLLADVPADHAAASWLRRRLQAAHKALAQFRASDGNPAADDSDEAMADIGRGTRLLVRAQVRAQQVIDVLCAGPADSEESNDDAT